MAADAIACSSATRPCSRAAGALDFDDLLLRARDLLAGDERVRDAWQRRFPYVLVDEYQDTNRTQYELVRLLAGPGGNLTVVGDEDQSIYSWRGADIQNILDFEHDFPGRAGLPAGGELPLDAERSSTPPPRSSPRTAGARARRCARSSAAASRCVCSRRRTSSTRPPGSSSAPRSCARRGRVAVLIRMNAQSRLFEEGLLRARVPYLVVGGVGFYERKEVKDVLAYLRLVRNPRDSVALRRVVNVPARGIGAEDRRGDRPRCGGRAARAPGMLWCG